MASIKIVRHVKIKGNHHIYDKQHDYWNSFNEIAVIPKLIVNDYSKLLYQ